jgi:transcriptional regulator with XRE-family HTH domain
VVNTIELKKAMLDAGVSQRKLAELSGISKNSINRKINGSSEFTSSEMIAVCDCLGITDPVRKCAIFLA